MLTLNRRGRNRWVLLTRRWALKFPTLADWRSFLFGLLNNMNEADWAGPGRCPVKWRAPGGFLIVMPRAEIMTDEQFASFDAPGFCERHQVNAEHKPDSFGFLDGEVVAVDFGW